MENRMMIDYRTEEEEIRRKVIDNCEFCVKDGRVWFVSNGTRYNTELENVIQVYFV